MKSYTEDFAKRYQQLRIVEDSKDKIVLELFNTITALEANLENAKYEVDDHKRLVSSFRQEIGQQSSDIVAMRRDQGKLSFVSVMVDGDGMNFLESLVQDGKNGGKEAARRLLKATEEHVHQVDPKVPPNTCYRVRVYANVSGLTRAYRADKILRDHEDLTTFIHGFNQLDPFCDFVDVGDGKECADFKIKGLLEKDSVDLHCRQIVFCASADNSYAPVFRAYRASTPISLVEGPPFAREMKEVAASFQTTSFKNVFMSNKLIGPRRMSFGPMTTTTTVTPPTTPTPNYASAAAKAAPLPQAASPPGIKLSTPAVIPKLSLCVDGQGYRVDRPLKTSPKPTITALKARKLCNRHHILADCAYGDFCTHKHNDVLTPQDLIDLMYIARATPCYTDVACRDLRCISGHRCVFGDKCSNKRECKFVHVPVVGTIETLEECQLN